jgi:hypothetical protein
MVEMSWFQQIIYGLGLGGLFDGFALAFIGGPAALVVFGLMFLLIFLAISLLVGAGIYHFFMWAKNVDLSKP